MTDSFESLDFQVLIALLDSSPDAMVITDASDKILFWNQACTKTLGYESSSLKNVEIARILPEYYEENFQDDIRTMHETIAVHQNGSSLWIEHSASAVERDSGRWTLHVFRDINARVQQMVELQREVVTDEVSKLLNRRGFQTQLESHLDQSLTLAIIDIDNFKDINDQFGHLAGDETIRFVADLLRECFPDAICISRMGGDEFSVLKTSGDQQQTTEQFEGFRNQLAKARIAPHSISPKVSIGVVISRQPSVSARELLTHADQSMYESKVAGRNQTTLRVL